MLTEGRRVAMDKHSNVLSVGIRYDGMVPPTEIELLDGEDSPHPVKFVGVKLAQLSRYFCGDFIFTETLYQDAEDKLLVHIKSRTANGGFEYFLQEITDEDLDPGGEFEYIGSIWRYL
jgi:hypothetical protein